MSESNPIILGAESIRAELDESPETHDLNSAQVKRILALDNTDLMLAINAEVDDDFWSQFDDVRARAITRLADDPLVNVIFLSGDDYETAVDAANDHGGSTDAVVAYLAQWDYGDENDGAAEVNGHTQLAELERLPQQLHEADHGGLHYWLGIDHGLRHYSLYRRPLS